MACMVFFFHSKNGNTNLTRFLLARLHFNSLIGKDTPKAILKALEKLETGGNAYNTAYEHAMERIEGQIKDQAKRAKQVISWITCATRPLTTLELQHALAVETDVPELDEDNIPEVENMVSVCAGLVTVDRKSGVVRLVHYTTQDYFIGTRNKWFPDAQLSIATICTTYLSYQSFATGYTKTLGELMDRLALHPFYDYAACNWAYHSREGSAWENDGIFLQKPAQVRASVQALLYGRRGERFGTELSYGLDKWTVLHLAAFLGLKGVMETLLEERNLDVRNGDDQTPLSQAAGEGHEAIVRLLLNTEGVNPDSKDRYGETPLAHAANNRHEAIVRLLLNTEGVNPDSKDRFGETPLKHAANNGHEAIVRLLLNSKGVNPNLKDEFGETPLAYAARNGHEAIVRLLLATRGSIDLKDEDGQQ